MKLRIIKHYHPSGDYFIIQKKGIFWHTPDPFRSMGEDSTYATRYYTIEKAVQAIKAYLHKSHVIKEIECQ